MAEDEVKSVSAPKAEVNPTKAQVNKPKVQGAPRKKHRRRRRAPAGRSKAEIENSMVTKPQPSKKIKTPREKTPQELQGTEGSLQPSTDEEIYPTVAHHTFAESLFTGTGKAKSVLPQQKAKNDDAIRPPVIETEETESIPKPEQQFQPKSDAEPELYPDAVLELELQPEAMSDTASKQQFQPDVKPESESEPGSEHEPKTEVTPVSASQLKTEIASEPEELSQPLHGSEADFKPVFEPHSENASAKVEVELEREEFPNDVAKPRFHLKYIVFTALLVVAGFLFVSGIGYQAYNTVYSGIAAFFKEKPRSVPVAVVIDQNFLDSSGLSAAYLFANNLGSSSDTLASSIQNAFYFGYLAEPAAKGETGITAVYHYGQHKDIVARANLFIGYIQNLRELKSLYDTDVYAMLNRSAQRDLQLTDYLVKLKNIRINSVRIVKELGLQIDDLKISYNSLNPDRGRFEQDFFGAVEGLAGDKADFLLQSFVDVVQKQTALKARMSALQQILELYEQALSRLNIRIEAIEKNIAVLLQGIKVIDIPGANLDIIIRNAK